MNIVFFGNTKYSVIVAQALLNEYGLSSIVTIPNRPIGRKKISTPTPVKQFALDNSISILVFERLNKSVVNEIAKLQPDFLIVADYGLILPKELLTIPKYTALNVHHSLLPKYRGPSPAPTAILNGDKISGVTIIKMTERVDAGPILRQKEYALKPYETTDSLLTALNTLGGELVIEVIKNYETLKPIAQDESAASITKRIAKQDGFIDLANPPTSIQLDRMIRAFYPWPSVWTSVQIAANNKQQLTNNKKVIKFLPDQKFQVEGGKPMSLKDFLNGYPEMQETLAKLGLLG